LSSIARKPISCINFSWSISSFPAEFSNIPKCGAYLSLKGIMGLPTEGDAAKLVALVLASSPAPANMFLVKSLLSIEDDVVSYKHNYFKIEIDKIRLITQMCIREIEKG